MNAAMLLCVALCCASPEEPSRLSIQADDDPTRVVVRYRIPERKSADWTESMAAGTDAKNRRCWISLHLVNGDSPSEADFQQPGILGTCILNGGVAEYRPRFALGRGNWYTAFVVESTAPGEPYLAARKTYEVPVEGPREPTSVGYVSPPLDLYPANLLKFRISFNRPMREGREVFSRIHLLDAAGREIPHPWRDLELWAVEGCMLHLYIHPGRIKQGVNLREELGPVLEPRKKYTLVVDAAMRDANGFPLKEEFRHEFFTENELRKKIDPAAWKFELEHLERSIPKAGTDDPLVVEFDRLLDLHKVDDVFTIYDPKGKKVEGSFETNGGMRYVLFNASEPWKWEAGKYRLVVNPRLTDFAGNTPLRVFDRDLDDRSHDPIAGPVERTFTIH
jgi:hypothetical protein